MADDVRRLPIEEFRRLGFLQEVNRQFFHPHGLALEVTVGDDGTERLGGVWDYRDDPEGVAYGDDVLSTPEAIAKAEYVVGVRDGLRESRIRALGFDIQPLPVKS